MTIDAGAAGVTPPFQPGGPEQPAPPDGAPAAEPQAGGAAPAGPAPHEEPEPQPAQEPDVVEQPEPLPLIDRVAALEATVARIEAVVDHLDAAVGGGLTEEVKEHVRVAVDGVARELSNVKAAVSRATGAII